MTNKKDKQVCLCNGVTEREILQLLKRGARDLDEVKKITLAATGCGKCKCEVEAVLEFYFNHKKPDLQQRLDF